MIRWKPGSGLRCHQRIPDSVLGEADEIVNVDLAPEDLLHRLEEGKIYPQERISTALENFFQRTNFDKLQELTLREIASQIDLKYRAEPEEDHEAVSDQVMVCLSSRGPQRCRIAALCFTTGRTIESELVCGLRANTKGRNKSDRCGHSTSDRRNPHPGQAIGGPGLSLTKGRTWWRRSCKLPENTGWVILSSANRGQCPSGGVGWDKKLWQRS